jgi:hypothetical protein
MDRHGRNKRGTNAMDAVEFNIVDVLNSKARRLFETTVHHHAAPSPQRGERIGGL